MNRIDLDGRRAVVTGGCRGIGLAVVERMLASGATVTVWDVDEAELAKIATRPGVTTRRVDVTREQDVAQGIAAAAADARIDILVNAAGIAGQRVKMVDCGYAEWLRVVDVNLNGTFLCCRETLRHMQSTGYGRIVNVASIAGKEGNAFAGHYSAAKAGVIALTKALAKEALDGDIRINCVAPAAVQTALFEAMPPDRQKVAVGRIPLGRAGRPGEVAAMIAWIASEECSFTTGFAFDLSGGRATY
jgi:3-oxoacyl-[acyl-carrier protein] reductase